MNDCRCLWRYVWQHGFLWYWMSGFAVVWFMVNFAHQRCFYMFNWWNFGLFWFNGGMQLSYEVVTWWKHEFLVASCACFWPLGEELAWWGHLVKFFLACLAQERVTANKRAKTRAQTHFGLLCGEKRVLGPHQVSVTSVCWTCLGLGRLDCVAFRVRGFWILVELDFRTVAELVSLKWLLEP